LANSFFDLDHATAEREAPDTILAGDLVQTSPNQFPQWRVIAVHDDKAWLRDVQTHADGVAELGRCRKVAA
jgi:hypothetical protein